MPITSKTDTFLNLDSYYGLIRFHGPEAIGFLQRQLTCDLRAIESTVPLHGAWLNPAGRVLATIALITDGDSLVGLTSRDLVDTVISGISRFLLNARLTISTHPGHIVGLIDADEPGTATGLQSMLPWPGGRHIRIAADPGVDDCSSFEQWQRIDVLNRMIRVDAQSSGQYLPQMLALDTAGAISFDKGCFPGQEIVARTHYLGKVKRCLVGLESDSVLNYGDSVVDETGHTLGEIIQVAPSQEGCLALAVIKGDPAEMLFNQGGTALKQLPSRDVPLMADG